MIAYKVDYNYKNDVELLDIVIQLYSKTMLKQPLSDKELIVLREYMLNGYSKYTKDAVRLTLKIPNAQTLNTMNYHLQKKGFLRPHPNNQRLKLLNDDLIALKDCFMSNETSKKVFIVNLIKKKNDGNIPQ